MPWTLVPLNRSLGDYRRSWDALNDAIFAGHPYFHSDFIEPLLRHFSNGGEHLCVHTSQGRHNGMVIAHPLSRLKWELFAPPQLQVCPLLVEDPRFLSTLVEALPGIPLGVDLLCQDPLNSPLPRARDLALSSIPHTHTIALDLRGTFIEYWNSRTSKDLRKNLARRMRRMADEGIVATLGHIDQPEDMAAAVERFGEIESAGWKGKAGTAVHRSNAQGAFYTELMQAFAERRMASVYELRLSGQLAATQLCILAQSMLVFLKTTYDESLARHSPGMLLKYLMIQREFELQRVPTIEYYTNADHDQLAWSTSDRWLQHHTLFRNRWMKAIYDRVKGRQILPVMASAQNP